MSTTIDQLLAELDSIISQIRRVKPLDPILPEDHNLQTDAIKKIREILEQLRAVQAAPPPPTPESGGDPLTEALEDLYSRLNDTLLSQLDKNRLEVLYDDFMFYPSVTTWMLGYNVDGKIVRPPVVPLMYTGLVTDPLITRTSVKGLSPIGSYLASIVRKYAIEKVVPTYSPSGWIDTGPVVLGAVAPFSVRKGLYVRYAFRVISYSQTFYYPDQIWDAWPIITDYSFTYVKNGVSYANGGSIYVYLAYQQPPKLMLMPAQPTAEFITTPLEIGKWYIADILVRTDNDTFEVRILDASTKTVLISETYDVLSNYSLAEQAIWIYNYIEDIGAHNNVIYYDVSVTLEIDYLIVINW